MKFDDFDALTFDVVGTLIDFETGILKWFRPTLRRYGASKTDAEILAAVEDKYQRTTPEKTFTEMLPLVYRDVASAWGVEFRDEGAESFGRSIRSWPLSPYGRGASEMPTGVFGGRVGRMYEDARTGPCRIPPRGDNEA